MTDLEKRQLKLFKFDAAKRLGYFRETGLLYLADKSQRQMQIFLHNPARVTHATTKVGKLLAMSFWQCKGDKQADHAGHSITLYRALPYRINDKTPV